MEYKTHVQVHLDSSGDSDVILSPEITFTVHTHHTDQRRQTRLLVA